MEHRVRKILTSLIAILAATNLEAQQSTPKLVVCITVDQLRGDYIEYFYNTFGERGFKRLMNEGLVYNNIRFEFSDIDEASAFATLFTGSNPNFNGIAGKNIYDFDKEKEVSVLYDPDIPSPRMPRAPSFPPDMRQTVLSGWTITTANGQQRPTTKGFLGMWTATTTARNLCRHGWSR